MDNNLLFLEKLNKLEQEINDGQYRKVYDKISELEEEIILYPKEYAEKLEKIKKLLSIETKKSVFQEQLSKKSKVQLLNIVSNNFDIYLFNYMINKFKTELNTEDYAKINMMLSDKKVSNSNKLLILDILKDEEISIDITFINSYTNEKKVFNTTSNFQIEKSSDYLGLLKSLSNLFYKEPSKLAIAKKLLLSFFIYFYPKPTIKELDNKIYNLINCMFENKEYSDKEFNDLIIKISSTIDN